MMNFIYRTLTITLLIIAVFLLFLPNVFNHREAVAFDGSTRLAGSNILKDSSNNITAVISDFYERGRITQWLLGEHHRQLWSTPVTFPEFQWMNDSVRLEITKLGGGQQTTSFALTDENGLSYTLRSVNKDQSGALPGWLQKTGLRTLFRDQASALDPYAAPVVDQLSKAAGIFTTQPKMFFVKDSPSIPEEYRPLLSNRVMLLEIEPDETWKGNDLFGRPETVISSGRMQELLINGEINVDALQYAYCRLFDITIGDWDRHGKQWKWSVDSTNTAHPIPVDRDMAFYKFEDGVINGLAIRVNPKFQSFNPVIEHIPGYLINGKELDSVLLASISLQEWKRLADSLKSKLTARIIDDAFSYYPVPVYHKVGADHIKILKERVRQLDHVAAELSKIYGEGEDSPAEI